MRVIFWASAIFIIYVYVGYPVLLLVWARLFPRKVCQPSARPAAAPFPRVSIILAARDEARRLPARIRNLLSLDYPEHLREIIVVSDGSSDETPAALAPYRGSIELLWLPPDGKAAALNAGVAHATGDILVFADARQTFGPDAIHALTAPFADHSVGGVSGELVLGCESLAGRRQQTGERRTHAENSAPIEDRRVTVDRRTDRTSTVGDGVGFYWRYEKRLRRLESTIGSMIGATGAIYALRRSLWRPLPAGTILDDVLAPMRAVLAGARIVFERRAQAYDRTAPDAETEGRRKVRTLAGNVQILWAEPRLLIPFRNPLWLQYWSHKIGRLLVPYALAALLASSISLATEHFFYAAVLIAQAGFYLESAYGAWLEYHRRRTPAIRQSLPERAGRMAFTFVAMNASAVAGLGAALFNRKVWR